MVLVLVFKGIEVFYGESNNLLLLLATTFDRDRLYDQIISQRGWYLLFKWRPPILTVSVTMAKDQTSR